MRKAQILQLQVELDQIDQFLNNIDVDNVATVPENQHLYYLTELEQVTNSLNMVYDQDRQRLKDRISDNELIGHYLVYQLSQLEGKKRTDARQKALKQQLGQLSAYNAELERQLEQIKQDFIRTLSGVFNQLAADVRQTGLV